MKKYSLSFLLVGICMLFTGCSQTETAPPGIPLVYLLCTLLPLVLLFVYGYLVRKKDIWFIMQLLAVFAVNSGVFSLSTSKTLEAALLASRIFYFGTLSLLLSTLMVILHSCHLTPPSWLTPTLCGLCFGMFVLTATPGYSNVFYREVSLINVHGAAVLRTAPAPLYWLYVFFLLCFVLVMVLLILHAIRKGKLVSYLHSFIMLTAVLTNLFVWVIEQILPFEFDFLSFTYVISASFLLMLNLLQQNHPAPAAQPQSHAAPVDPPVEAPIEKAEEEPLPALTNPVAEKEPASPPAQLPPLTPTERAVFELYTEGKTSKEIMDILNIKENTLKYHNKNLYSKLGISTRKELLQLAASAKTKADE